MAPRASVGGVEIGASRLSRLTPPSTLPAPIPTVTGHRSAFCLPPTHPSRPLLPRQSVLAWFSPLCQAVQAAGFSRALIPNRDSPCYPLSFCMLSSTFFFSDSTAARRPTATVVPPPTTKIQDRRRLATLSPSRTYGHIFFLLVCGAFVLFGL